ncbi:MAG TPA: dienelactone hydrolase family protein [Chloroflexota bacterium]
MAIQESELLIDDLRAICFRPEGPSKGGVLLLPTNHGTSGINKKHSSMLAAAGLTTLLWDPYPGRGLPKDDERSAWSGAVDDDWAVQGQSRWLTYMIEELGVERLGTLGFCMGGRYALLLGAKDHRLAAVTAFYPTVRKPKPDHQKYDAIAMCAEIRCAVTLVCPGQDHITTQEVYSDLRQTLRVRPEPTIAQMYPHAGHGFMQAGEPADAVKMAWPQAVGFMTACLL